MEATGNANFLVRAVQRVQGQVLGGSEDSGPARGNWSIQPNVEVAISGP